MFMKLVLCLSILVSLLAIFYNPAYLGYLKSIVSPKQKSKHNVFTIEELSLFNGVDKEQLYLSLLGNVFDVTDGSKHYGPGQSYNIFVGRDATRNFITGKFNIKDISDDVVGLTHNDFKQLDYWLTFYKKEYKKIGKLIGRYYDYNGKLTQYGKEIHKLIKLALKEDDDKSKLKKLYPPCNAEWDATIGSRVWCTQKSGGIQRDWIGFPRKYYEPGSENHRCACINDENLSLGNIQEYDNCDSNSHSCYVKN